MQKLKKLTLAFLSIIIVQAANAQTVDEVINKYIEVIGGKEKMLALKTVKMQGGLSVNGFDIGIVNTISNGVGLRTDIAVPGMEEGFQIMTPTKGWSYLPFQGQTGPVEESEDRVKSGQASLDLQGPLLNYKEKGHTAELIGKEKSDDVECFKIKLTHKNGKVTFYYFDAVTFYKIKATSKAMVNGEETETVTTYSDFKKTPEGYLFAFSQTNARGTIVFSSIEVNKPVDESIFKVN